MASVLKNLFYGNLSPVDRAYAPTPSAQVFQSKLEKQNEIAKQLESRVDAHSLALFQAYCEKQAEISLDEQEELFIYAFRLGAQWTREVFCRAQMHFKMKSFAIWIELPYAQPKCRA